MPTNIVNSLLVLALLLTAMPGCSDVRLRPKFADLEVVVLAEPGTEDFLIQVDDASSGEFGFSKAYYDETRLAKAGEVVRLPALRHFGDSYGVSVYVDHPLYRGLGAGVRLSETENGELWVDIPGHGMPPRGAPLTKCHGGAWLEVDCVSLTAESRWIKRGGTVRLEFSLIPAKKVLQLAEQRFDENGGEEGLPRTLRSSDKPPESYTSEERRIYYVKRLSGWYAASEDSYFYSVSNKLGLDLIPKYIDALETLRKAYEIPNRSRARCDVMTCTPRNKDELMQYFYEYIRIREKK